MATGTYSIMPIMPSQTENTAQAPVMTPEERFRQIMQFGYKPQFQDTLYPLSNEFKIGNRGADFFERGIQSTQPSGGISPETQRILDIIKQNQAKTQTEGISAARANALRRGIGGSSTEMFGINQAVESAARSGQEQEVQVLLANLQREQTLKDLQSRALFERAGTESSLGAQESQFNFERLKQISGLTSDEVASLRNLSESQKARDLQKYLGERGIAVQSEAANLQADAARRASSPMNLILGGVGQGIGAGVGAAVGRF